MLDVLETASLLERDSAGEREGRERESEVVAHAPANCRKGCAQQANLVTWQKV